MVLRKSTETSSPEEVPPALHSEVETESTSVVHSGTETRPPDTGRELRDTHLESRPVTASSPDTDPVLVGVLERLARIEGRDRFIDDILHRLRTLETLAWSRGGAEDIGGRVLVLESDMQRFTESVTALQQSLSEVTETQQELTRRLTSLESQTGLPPDAVPEWFSTERSALVRRFDEETRGVAESSRRRLESLRGDYDALVSRLDGYQARLLSLRDELASVGVIAEGHDGGADSERSEDDDPGREVPAQSQGRKSGSSRVQAGGGPPPGGSGGGSSPPPGGDADGVEVLEEGGDPMLWDHLAPRLPQQPKVRDFPILVGKLTPDGLPFVRWQHLAWASLRVGGLHCVVETRPPLPSQSESVRSAYATASACVYQAILRAAQGVSVLSDELARLSRQDDCGYAAWFRVKAHFVREASTNRSDLQTQLRGLKPQEGESMESFLSRCDGLKEKYLLYNLVLEDKELIVQVFSELGHTWRTAVRLAHPGQVLDEMSWGLVRESLRVADTERRQSNLQAPDAEYPLGWRRKEKSSRLSTADAHAGHGASTHRPSVSGPVKGKSAKGKGEKHRASGSTPSSSRAASPTRSDSGQQTKTPREIKVCYYCHGSHFLPQCKKKPSGWRLTEEAKRRADQIREERLAQSRAARGAVAAARQAQAQPDIACTSMGSARSQEDTL